LKERAQIDALEGMRWGTKRASEKVERAKRAVVEAEQRLAKAQEAIAKANAGVLRAERHLKSAKRKLKLAGQRAAALEAEKAAVSVRARAMAERVIEGRTLKQIGDEWGINKDRVRQIVVGTAGGPPGGRPTSTVAPRAALGSLWRAAERARISRLAQFRGTVEIA
jgi:DNA-binding CsgD family transcriptional regulator